jgi:glycosyltransferase involved in cell wall biosynthesis
MACLGNNNQEISEEVCPVAHNADRPLVTFALVAYNQERYIRAAIEGAFSQTYEPLEIILSDDCSTDSTFEIMQEMAQSYGGRHTVIANRPSENLGTFRHFYQVSKIGKGKLIVAAAGDDISLPHRVATLVANWRATRAWGLCSHYNTMDFEGVRRGSNLAPNAAGNLVWQYFLNKTDKSFVSGVSSAYDRALFDLLPEPQERIFHEDTLLTLILHAVGKPISIVPEALVDYRVYVGSYSNQPSFKQTSISEIEATEMTIAAYCRDTRAYLEYFMGTFVRSAEPTYNLNLRVDFAAIEREARIHDLQSNWISTSLGLRLRRGLSCRSLEELLILAPRMFGLRSFARMKLLLNIIKGL